MQKIFANDHLDLAIPHDIAKAASFTACHGCDFLF